MAKKRTDGDAVAVWAEYRRNATTANRNAVVRHYLPLVTLHANKMKNSVPCDLDRGDLMQAGALGLIRAVELFDPSRQLKFETYAGYRVRGAMLDWIRNRSDWFPRGVRHDHPDVVMLSYDAVGQANGYNKGSGSMIDMLECLSYEDTGIITSQRVVDLRLAMVQLPRQMRMMVRLHWFDGLTMAEVGKAMGVSDSWVSRVLIAAKTSLKKMLEEVQP